jgi:hypothetical protein
VIVNNLKILILLFIFYIVALLICRTLCAKVSVTHTRSEKRIEEWTTQTIMARATSLTAVTGKHRGRNQENLPPERKKTGMQGLVIAFPLFESILSEGGS